MKNAKENAMSLINPGEYLARILKRKMQAMNNIEKKGNEDMWKLTITQKRKSEYTDGTISESVVFLHRTIGKLTSLVDSLNTYENDGELAYKLEKVGEE